MLAAVVAAASLVFSQADAGLAYDTAKSLVDSCTPRDAGTIRGREASNLILDAASAAGADVRRDVFSADTPRGRREFINLYAEFGSSTNDDHWVILLSHFDTKPGTGCPGANDGASTSGLLVGLASAVSDWTGRRGRLMMIWTDGEECMHSYGPNDGFWGSRRAAGMVSERKLKVQAVICLDMLGDRDLAIMVPANGCPSLARIAVCASAKAGYPGLVRMSDEFVKDDHVAFLDAGFKAIDMIDFSYGPNNAYWHTAGDTMEHVSRESLLKAGSVVAEMLNILL